MPKINFHVILKFIGILLCMESIFMLVPFVVALIYGEGDAPAFIKSASITAIVGGILFYIFRNSRNDVGKRESYLLVTSIWLFFSAFGMLPFCLMPNHLSITDAIFETVSGQTVINRSIGQIGFSQLFSIPRQFIFKCRSRINPHSFGLGDFQLVVLK